MYIFPGTGDLEACESSIADELLGLDVFCPASPCAVNGVYQPELTQDTTLYLFAGYYYSAKFLECAGESNVKCLETGMKDAIKHNWTELQTLYVI